MRTGSFRGAGYLFVALFPAACSAAASASETCYNWQVKFHQVQATWLEGATSKAEVERLFGVPTRVEANGGCTHLNYAAAGCSCWFTICSLGTVVSKTLVVGAAAAPAFLSEDPAALAQAIRSLQEGLREVQGQMLRLQQVMDGLSPPPAPGPVAPPPAVTAARPAPRLPTEARQCAAKTLKGVRCTRPAAAGSVYCWQHRK